VFKKEIRFEEKASINLKLAKMKADYSRWTMVHEIIKNTDTIAAVLTVDGAWMDTQKRKLVLPPAVFIQLLI
jgi:acyl-CoA thioester hydrolase